MAIDGFTLDVPDTEKNTEEFGRWSNGTQQAAFPQVRVVALAECGSHAIVGAALDGCRTGEQLLAERVIGSVESDMLVIADGSYLSVVTDSAIRGARRGLLLLQAARDGAELDPDQAVLVRVVEYEVPDRDGNGTGELICVITTILDPNQVDAAELAITYHERWEAENTLDELKTHQRGPARILRSKSPNMVKQEIWALLLTHYSIRHLMCRAADEADVNPDRISFMRSLRIVRRQVTRPADFPP